MPDSATVDRTEIQRAIELGMELCRLGEWEQGFPYLLKVLEEKTHFGDMPGLFYSSLAYGLARFERRYREALRLAEHAIKIEFYEPANFVHLAQIHLLMGDRRRAVSSLEKALKIHPHHPEILELQYRMGVRRRPVIPFLSRDNPLNYWLGRLRSLLER